MKALNNGRTIEGLPASVVLEHDEIPAPVADAVESWRESLVVLADAVQAHRAAEAAARETTLRVRGERERYDAEIRQKTREETDALRAAERGSSAAARVLIAALQEHADEVRRISALLALHAHAESVDAALSLQESRARFAAAGGRRFGLRPDVDAELVAARRANNVREGVLDDLDRVNAHRLAEAAGTRLDLVEVRDEKGVTILTTLRRAAALVGTGSTGWSLVEDEEASR